MASRFRILVSYGAILCCSLGYGQGRDIAFTVTDGDTTATLHLGLDPAATDGIDAGLGEAELPPAPPAGAFDARFTGTDIGLDLKQGVLKDYRSGTVSSIGVRTHELLYQVGEGTTITIGWNMPADVTARLQDLVTGKVINVFAKGTGSFTLTNPALYPKILLTVHYKPILAQAKVFLQGPFNTGTGEMNKSLNVAGLLTSHFGAGKYPVSAVDSVNIEIRNAAVASEATVRRFAPAWVMSNGTLRNFADTAMTEVAWDSIAEGSYYIVIRHRNHIAAMSANAVTLNSTSALYDFTTGLVQYFNNDACYLAAGVYGLWGGDADCNGDVGATDRTATWNERNQVGYVLSDVDLSGDVSAPDRTMTWNNRNKFSQVP